MEIKKVISRKNLPVKLPFVQTLSVITALDYWKAPQYLWGSVGLFYVVIWAATFYAMGTQKEVDILKDGNSK